jgi:hypothetical protein
MIAMAQDNDSIITRAWAKAAEVSGIAPEQINRGSTLESLGLSSSDAVILAMEIEEIVGGPVDVGIFLRHETLGGAINEIANLFARKAGEQGPASR